MGIQFRRNQFIYFLIFICVIIIIFKCYPLFFSVENPCINEKFEQKQITIFGKNNIPYSYDRYSKFIFIGGFPRSGTTLIRVMLDAHSDIRCGEETHVIPNILSVAYKWNQSISDSKRLMEAGLTQKILDDGIASFILEIIIKHGPPANRLCNKDPFTINFGNLMYRLFPNSKFIFMIRDGRAVVHSIISRGITISGFDLKNYQKCLIKWSNSIKEMLQECKQLGETNCLIVKYETLVLYPEKQMNRILNYLDVPWENNVLHHENFINKFGGVTLSKYEKSTDQVINPITINSLSNWVGQIPEDVVKNMENIAPMLRVLGYDPLGNPPEYG